MPPPGGGIGRRGKVVGSAVAWPVGMGCSTERDSAWPVDGQWIALGPLLLPAPIGNERGKDEDTGNGAAGNDSSPWLASGRRSGLIGGITGTKIGEGTRGVTNVWAQLDSAAIKDQRPAMTGPIGASE